MRRSILIIVASCLAFISTTSAYAQPVPVTKSVTIGQDIMEPPRGWKFWGWFIQACHPEKKEFTLRWHSSSSSLRVAEGDSFMVLNNFAMVKFVKFGSECHGVFDTQYLPMPK